MMRRYWRELLFLALLIGLMACAGHALYGTLGPITRVQWGRGFIS